MKSTAIGSAVSVLLVFSAISYAKSYIQHQDPKPVQPAQPQFRLQTSNLNLSRRTRQSESKVSGTGCRGLRPHVHPGPA